MSWYKLYALFLGLCLCNNAVCNTLDSRIIAAWGYSDSVKGSSSDFIISGGLGKGTHGTHADEWAVVGVIAEKVVANGGYFCPYQIQCANERKNKNPWTVYYRPTGFKNVTDNCLWLCADGYSGENCMTPPENLINCDSRYTNTTDGAVFGDVKIMTSGGDQPNFKTGVDFFETGQKDTDAETGKWEYNSLLGIVRFLDHGVVAAPVKVQCARDNWREIDSFVESIYVKGDEKLLCAEGFKPNANNTDCEAIDFNKCDPATLAYCQGFNFENYDAGQHSLINDTAGRCVKYFCRDDDMAFTGGDDKTCVECAVGLKGGAHSVTGTCVKCDTGEVFDKKSNSCVQAKAFSKVDMQYGIGKSRMDQSSLNDQCWTKVSPDDYVECMSSTTSGKKPSNKSNLDVLGNNDRPGRLYDDYVGNTKITTVGSNNLYVTKPF